MRARKRFWVPSECLLGASWAHLGRVLARFGRRLGAEEGPKREPTSFKNRCKNRSIFGSLLRSDFLSILIDFCSQNGAKLVAKSDQNWTSTSKGDFLEKLRFSPGKTINLMVRGSEVESKIDQKSLKNEGQDRMPLGIDF